MLLHGSGQECDEGEYDGNRYKYYSKKEKDIFSGVSSDRSGELLFVLEVRLPLDEDSSIFVPDRIYAGPGSDRS